MTELAGTLRLARVAARRDRVTLPTWILGITAFQWAVINMSVSGLSTRDDLLKETQLVATTPALRMLGAPTGASIGGYAMVRGFLTIAILAGVMSLLTVVRHTRQNEELGRSELVAATGVGRYAALAAAVAVASLASLVLAIGLAAVLTLAGQPALGSGTAGAAVGGVALVMVGVAAVASQLTGSARGAIGWATAVLGWAFAWQAVGNVLGDVSPDGLSVSSAWPGWLSPLTWGQQLRPFTGERLWPALLFMAAWLALLVVAVALVRRRDLGQGMLPDRVGPDRASASLTSAFGLSWRLQRSAFRGWMVAMVGFGVVFGGLSEQIRGLSAQGKEWYVEVGGSDQILQAYQASIIQFAGIAVAGYVVQTLLRLHVDEAHGTLEPLLAAGTSRWRWLAGHALTALLGSCTLLTAFALTMGAVAGRAMGDVSGQWAALVPAALAQFPAITVLAAVVVAVVALAPRWSMPITWALFLVAVVLSPFFAPSVQAPEWLARLSPFTHLSRLPGTEVGWGPLLALVAAACLAAAAGGSVLRHRDLRLSG